MRVRISAKAFHRRTAPPAQCGDGTNGCRQKIMVSINEQHRERLCLRGTCKIRSDAYACVFRVESLPVPSEKTSPLHSPDPSLGCGQPAPPLQYWRLRSTTLNKKGTIFRTAKPVPSSALLASNLASIGGAGVRHGENGGDVFSLGTDSGAMVLHCYLRACVVWSMDAGKSYRWARHTRSKKQAMATMAFDAHRGADPAFTPGQDRNVLLLLITSIIVGFCRNCRNRVGTV